MMYLSSALCMGSNGPVISCVRTVLKLHIGAGAFLGGAILLDLSRTLLMTGAVKKLLHESSLA